MSNTFTPTAQQSKDTADSAALLAYNQNTQDFIEDTLESVQAASQIGEYQFVADYSATTINLDRVIHVLAVELHYRVSDIPTSQELLIDWSIVPRVAPPTKDGIPRDALGNPT